MKLSALYAEQAVRETRVLEDLLAQEDASLARRRRLRALEESFARMASDGALTESEIEEIVSALRSEGIETSVLERLLDGCVSTSGAEGALPLLDPEGARKRDSVLEAIRRGIDDQRDIDDRVGLEIQIHANEYRIAEEAASRLERSGFDADMAVIENMLA